MGPRLQQHGVPISHRVLFENYQKRCDIIVPAFHFTNLHFVICNQLFPFPTHPTLLEGQRNKPTLTPFPMYLSLLDRTGL